jgi:hypothetical protein
MIIKTYSSNKICSHLAEFAAWRDMKLDADVNKHSVIEYWVSRFQGDK